MPAKHRGLYRGDYPVRRRRLFAAMASGNLAAVYAEVRHLFPVLPDELVCWRCRQPLSSCGPNRNGRTLTGRPATWEAGHVVSGDPLSPLAPECKPCNAAAGARHGNVRRSPSANPTSRRW